MLESDPDKRPDIWQVSEVVCRMQGKTNTVPKVFVSGTVEPNNQDLRSKEATNDMKFAIHAFYVQIGNL